MEEDWWKIVMCFEESGNWRIKSWKNRNNFWSHVDYSSFIVYTCVISVVFIMVTKNAKKNLIIGYITVFMDVLGYSLITPILPFLANSMGANDFEEGLMFSGYCLTQALSNFCT